MPLFRPPLACHFVAAPRPYPGREGIWGTAMTAQMVQRIVQIEEETGGPLINRPEEQQTTALVVHEIQNRLGGFRAESAKFWTGKFRNEDDTSGWSTRLVLKAINGNRSKRAA